MEFKSISQVLQSDEIIDCNLKGNVHRVDNLLSSITQVFKRRLLGNFIASLGQHQISFCQTNSSDTFFHEGIDCRVLKTDGSGWHNAKLRFQLVAEIKIEEQEQPEITEPLSPLDDIRQSIQD